MAPRHRGNVITATFDRSRFPSATPSQGPTLLRKGSHSTEYSGPEGAESVNADSDGTEFIIAQDLNGDTIKINRNELRRRLSHLFTLRDQPIDSLGKADAEIFKSIVDISQQISHSEIYKSFVREVESMGATIRSLAGSKPVAPATVGAFLEGCFVRNSFQGPSQCSPHCAGSLAQPNAPACDAMVLLKSKSGQIFSLNQQESDKAYLYLENEAGSLTAADFELLSQGGVKYVSLVHTVDGNGQYSQQDAFVSLDQLRGQGSTPALSPAQPRSVATGGNQAGLMILVFLLLLALVAIILAIIFGAGSRRTAEYRV